MRAPGGAYAEYAVAPAHTVFKLPQKTSFEGTHSRLNQSAVFDFKKTLRFAEAATIPLVALTAALSLSRRQQLPAPWSPRSSSAPPLPLIIYGASSALGSFALKLAKFANIHPIIAICGGSRSYVEKLIDPVKGDVIIDYRNGVQAMQTAVREALGNLKARHALDAISGNGTWVPLTQMVDPEGGQVSVVSGANRYDEPSIPSGVRVIYTMVGTVHSGAYRAGMPRQPVDKEDVKNDIEFAFLFLRYVGRLLAEGKFEGHPLEVIPGGLGGVQTGLRRLKNGEARGVKFVYRIDDTEGLTK